MSQLERRHHDQAEHHRPAEIDDSDYPPRKEEERNDEGPAEEHRLPGEKRGQIPPTRETHRALREPSSNQRDDIAGRLPADTHQGVQQPDVVVLEPVPRPGLLRRREPRDRYLAHIVVTTVDVRVGVVRHVVLDPPRIAAEPEQRISRPAQQMVVALLPKERPVVRVVLNAQRGQDQAERETGKAGRDHQELVGRHEQARPRDHCRRQRDCRLHIEAQDPGSSRSGVGEIQLDLAPSLTKERPTALEDDLAGGRHPALADLFHRRSHPLGPKSNDRLVALGHTPTERATDGNRGAALIDSPTTSALCNERAQTSLAPSLPGSGRRIDQQRVRTGDRLGGDRFQNACPATSA